jgi:hypothetical protein
VDSADTARLELAKAELNGVLLDEQLKVGRIYQALPLYQS